MNEIINDLKKSLLNIDKNKYVLNSIINHLKEQCSEEEIQTIEDKIFDLEVKDYETREAFIDDYQAIFDLVDFPINECFRILDKRTLNWNAL